MRGGLNRGFTIYTLNDIMNSDALKVILSAKPVFILSQDFLVYYDKQQQFRIKLGLTLVFNLRTIFTYRISKVSISFVTKSLSFPC